MAEINKTAPPAMRPSPDCSSILDSSACASLPDTQPSPPCTAEQIPFRSVASIQARLESLRTDYGEIHEQVHLAQRLMFQLRYAPHYFRFIVLGDNPIRRYLPDISRLLSIVEYREMLSTVLLSIRAEFVGLEVQRKEALEKVSSGLIPYHENSPVFHADSGEDGECYKGIERRKW